MRLGNMALTRDDIEIRKRQGLYRPLSVVARAEPRQGGIPTGLPSVDRTIGGGLRPGKLNLVTAFASHGKTSLMLTTVVNNLHRRCLFVSADDSDDMILRNLLAMTLDMPTDEVEEQGPEWREEMQADYLPNLIIASPQEQRSSYTVDDLAEIYDLASEDLGAEPELAFFDYIGLLGLGRDSDDGVMGMRTRFQRIKALIRQTPSTAWLVGHQANRSAGGDLAVFTMRHMEYGGQHEADGVIIALRRRLDTEKLTDEQMQWEYEHPTTNISVIKNKITGRKTMPPTGVPTAIDPISGKLRTLQEEEKFEQKHKTRGKVASQDEVIRRLKGG